MAKILRAIDMEEIAHLHPRTASGLFWELSPHALREFRGDPVLEKEAWLMQSLLQLGRCGLNYRLEHTLEYSAQATLLFTPGDRVPGQVVFPTAPVSPEAWLISSVHIHPLLKDTGLEATLIAAACSYLSQEKIPAVEIYGYHPRALAAKDKEDRGDKEVTARIEDFGLVEVNIAQGCGFKIHQPHPIFPRLRLKLPAPQREWELSGVSQLVVRV
ncbi:hypothetical protein N7326_07770 [Corynebacterium sp. ES2794-CONJ1]|uniref:hypothetical protein n=1 Tax=Corynebacterium sp. ES2794-CONJ1 TaxID=2980553 RepID=UPI0021D852BD|nr:hypothetical protein [Corynebacterium sp. ES2794-CONJ1]MCU9519760.1 hypothetical protein [Corynebacterium sp. ES2794-CONJ1]